MAEVGASESSSDTDREFDPSAEMMVNDFDDERTMEEEEAMDSGADSNPGNELDDLQKEGDMPLDQLLAMYGYGGGPSDLPTHETQSSSSEEILSNQDLTLDKDEIARDLLIDEENKSDENVSNGGQLDASDSVVPDYLPTPTSLLLSSNINTTQDATSSRLLRSVSHQSGYSGSESEDEDYIPMDDEDWRKTIQVGSDYQAQIPPGLCKYDDAPAYENEDKLLWDPHILQDSQVESYLREAGSAVSSAAQGVNAVPTGNHCQDDEQTLYLLLQCGHNVEEALRRKRMQTVPLADSMSLWSEEECRSFEIGLRTYGKDFHMIQQNKVKTRSVGELVYFYYLWKKTERHDMFANKTRLEKKKYALHPGTTDYMDRFLDDQENPQQYGHHNNHHHHHHHHHHHGSRDRSSSPNIHSLIYGDHKRQQHNRTPTFGHGSSSSSHHPQQQLFNSSSPASSSSSSSSPHNQHHHSVENSVSSASVPIQFTTAAPTVTSTIQHPRPITKQSTKDVANNALEQIATNLTSSGLCDIEEGLESLAKLAAATSTVPSTDFSASAISAAITSIANNNVSTKSSECSPLGSSLMSQQTETILNTIAMSVASVSSDSSLVAAANRIPSSDSPNNFQRSVPKPTGSAAH